MVDDKQEDNQDIQELKTKHDEEIYYVYEEEDDKGAEYDTSSLNYSQMSCEIQGATDIGRDSVHTSVFKLLLMLLTNPTEGWKAVRRDKLTVERAQINCFYPLLAIMALSHFADFFYTSRVELSEVIISGVTNFVGYFAGYFLIVILLGILLPKDSSKSMDSEFGKVFLIMNLSSLCIFFTSIELLPMLWPILIFLPLWTVYVICKGIRFLRFPENKTIYCTTMLCLLVIGVPSVIEWLLNEILPS